MAKTGSAKTSAAAIPVVSLTILCVAVLGVYSSTYLLLSVLPVYVRNLGHAESTVGSVMGLFSLAALLTRPFAGIAADRVGRRPSIFVGGVLICLSCIGYAIAGAQTIFIARLINGIGWGAVTAATATVAADLAPPSKRGSVLGIYGTVTGLAFAVGPGGGIWLADQLDLHTAFLVAAGSGLIAAIAVLFLRTPQARDQAAPTGISLNHFFSPTATGPALIMLAFSLVYGAVLTFVPLLTLDRGLGTSGRFFAVFAIALILLRLSGGRLSDRFGRPRVIAPGFVASAVAMVVIAGAYGQLMLLFSAVLFAGAFAFIQPATHAWSVDLSPAHRRGTTLATVIAAQDLGISLGAFTAGVLAEVFSYGALFIAAASISLLGLAAVGYTHRRTTAP